LLHVWRWYCEIVGSRQSGANGPDPLLWREIQAWSEMTWETIWPDEARLIKRLDTEYLNVWYSAQAAKHKKTDTSSKPSPKKK
jgi:hypothetical protein